METGPKIRLTEAPPFTVTGVDFAGPLYVKDKNGNERKVFICLFTCALRAVHLEVHVVPDLSEESFIQSFRRFTSRKSVPRTMISDNASTPATCATHGTMRTFTPRRAPWYGGFWEHLIGLTKT